MDLHTDMWFFHELGLFRTTDALRFTDIEKRILAWATYAGIVMRIKERSTLLAFNESLIFLDFGWGCYILEISIVVDRLTIKVGEVTLLFGLARL